MNKQTSVSCARPPLHRWLGLGLAATLLWCSTGCETARQYSLTYRLWDESDVRKRNEPAPKSNLALFEASNGDVLVAYDALREDRLATKRQAYYLESNRTLIESGKKPRFVRPAATENLKAIPQRTSLTEVTNSQSAGPSYVLTKDGLGFTLYRPQKPVEGFDLPVFAETGGTPFRVALTPFAVAGDTLMVCGVASVVGFILWLEAGAPPLSSRP